MVTIRRPDGRGAARSGDAVCTIGDVRGRSGQDADARPLAQEWSTPMRPGNSGQPPFWRAASSRSGGSPSERRVRGRIHLRHMTAADGEWLAHVLPTLQGHARPAPDAVQVEDVVLRHRPGHLGIADALDAAAILLDPFSAAGAPPPPRTELDT